MDILVILAHRQRSVDVAVGGGKSVGLGALLGYFHAVAHHVVAACVQTGKQAVPVALHILRLHAQLFGNGAGDLDVIAHQRVVRVVEAPGLPCAFQRHDEGAAALDGGEQVAARGGSTGGGSASGGSRGVIGGRAAAQAQHACRCHHAHQGDKGSSFHGWIPFSSYVQFCVKILWCVLLWGGRRTPARERPPPPRRFP